MHCLLIFPLEKIFMNLIVHEVIWTPDIVLKHHAARDVSIVPILVMTWYLSTPSGILAEESTVRVLTSEKVHSILLLWHLCPNGETSHLSLVKNAPHSVFILESVLVLLE